MWLKCILVAVVILYGTEAQKSYIITVPTTIRPGLNMDILVNILESTGPVTVTASLWKTTRIERPPPIGIFPILEEAAPIAPPPPPPPQPEMSTSEKLLESVIVVNAGQPRTVTLNLPDTLSQASYSIMVEGTGGLVFTKSENLQYRPDSLAVFVQTDKGIYKPGQKVLFRTFAVYPDLKPYTGAFDVDVYDGAGNKIKQMENVSGEDGVYSGEFTLSDKPVMGAWKIEAEAGDMKETVVVNVEEFVLPRFEVTVDVPGFGLTTDTELSGTVEAKYTFGKQVEGNAVIRVRRNFFFQPFGRVGGQICQEPIIEKQVTLNGKTPFRISQSELQFLGSGCNGEERLTPPGQPALSFLRGVVLKVEAEVVETLTGNKQTGEDKITYSEREFQLQWLASNSRNFKPGLWYDAFLKVSKIDGTPIPLNGRQLFVTLYVTATFDDGCGAFNVRNGVAPVVPEPMSFPTIQMIVPADGIIFWSNIVPNGSAAVTLTASFPGASNSTWRVEKMDSPSESYLQSILLTPSPKVGDEAVFEILSTAPMGRVVYQIVSRGDVVLSEVVDGLNKKTFYERIVVTNQMAPSSKFVIYSVLPTGEVLADSVSFNVNGLFENEVSIEVSESRTEPGQNISLVVSSDPNSLVNILAVDQSVLLLSKGNDITQTKVEDKISVFNGNTPISSFDVRRFPIPFNGGDVTSVFRNAGVSVLTDATLHVAESCRIFFQRRLLPVAAVAPDSPEVQTTGGPLLEPERVRTKFPDTWLWTDKKTGQRAPGNLHVCPCQGTTPTIKVVNWIQQAEVADGRAVFTATVPDTITSWVTGAFAMNSVTGLGVAPTNPKLEVFLPFFVTLNLPATVVRGEEVIVQAIVFNFLPQDLSVSVTLSSSPDFFNIQFDNVGRTVQRSTTVTQTIQVNSGEAENVFFPIVPRSLGSIDIEVSSRSAVAADALSRQLKVVPEGVEQEYTLPFLIDLSTPGSSFTDTVSIPFPPNVVPGSQRVTANVLGDLLGPTINNLDKLLKMPSGCGEQNMVNFAPDVFIMKYLSEVNQLSDEIREKATRFLESGYQRQLTFQRRSGSFSAFGNNDESGSTWLTAFVIKSFCEAKPFTLIDDRLVNKAIDWLVSKQSRDGSFPEVGNVIHKEMQGGSGSGTALTAYVLLALSGKETLTSDVEKQNQRSLAISQARGYLETQSSSLTDIYALSITAYALRKVNSRVADRAYSRLDSLATVSDAVKFWDVPERTAKPTRSGFWVPPNRSKAQNVEATAYGLLNLAIRRNVTEGLPVLRWLAQQRNAEGGFVSTQDTVVALESFSEFATLIYSPFLNVNVQLNAGSFPRQFQVTQSSALILQSADIPGPPSSVVLSASGTGTALVQISVTFNVFRDSQEPTFDVRVNLRNETINGFVLETCTTNLEEEQSGMVVQEIGIPTGFQADVDTITKSRVLKKTESLDRKVVLYFDQIGLVPECVSMNVNRVGLVAKSQPVAVRVFDYYSPEKQVTVFYRSQTLQDSNVCDICLDCGCPSI